GPRVLPGDRDGGRAVPGRPDDEGPLPRAGLVHGVQAVEHQVQHHLLQLNPIASHGRQIGGELEAQRYAPADRVALHEPRHFSDELVEVEGYEFEVALLDQGTQPPDYLGGPPIVRYDVAQDLAHLFEIRGGGGEQVFGHLRVAEDRGQRLVQVVGQGRGGAAEGRHPADVRQVLAKPLRLELPLLACQCVGKDFSEEVQLLDQLV